MKKTELEIAKELIELENSKLQKEADTIILEAVNKIKTLGFQLLPVGNFEGNQFQIKILIARI